MKIKPLGSRILFTKIDSDKEKSGIIIDLEKKRGDTGIVVAVGPDVTLIKPKDKILFPSYLPDSVQTVPDEEEMFLISEENVLAILK